MRYLFLFGVTWITGNLLLTTDQSKVRALQAFIVMVLVIVPFARCCSKARWESLGLYLAVFAVWIPGYPASAVLFAWLLALVIHPEKPATYRSG